MTAQSKEKRVEPTKEEKAKRVEVHEKKKVLDEDERALNALMKRHPEDMLPVLFRAIKENNEAALRACLKRGVPVFISNSVTFKIHNKTHHLQLTPLMLASTLGFLPIITLLLQANADPNQYGVHSITALFKAVENGHYDCATLLLKNKANPNVRALGKTPLGIAIHRDDKVLAKTLLRHGADPNVQSKFDGYYRKLPLVYAINKNNFEMAKLLLEYGARVYLSGRDISNYETPLYQAIRAKDLHKEMIRLLIVYGANPKQQVDVKTTALMFAEKRKSDSNWKEVYHWLKNPEQTKFEYFLEEGLKALEEKATKKESTSTSPDGDGIALSMAVEEKRSRPGSADEGGDGESSSLGMVDGKRSKADSASDDPESLLSVTDRKRPRTSSASEGDVGEVLSDVVESLLKFLKTQALEAKDVLSKIKRGPKFPDKKMLIEKIEEHRSSPAKVDLVVKTYFKAYQEKLSVIDVAKLKLTMHPEIFSPEMRKARPAESPGKSSISLLAAASRLMRRTVPSAASHVEEQEMVELLGTGREGSVDASSHT